MKKRESKFSKMCDLLDAEHIDEIYYQNGFKALTGNCSFLYDVKNNGREKYVKNFNSVKNWLINYRENNKNDDKYVETIKLGKKLLRKFNNGYKMSCRFATWSD